MGPPSARRKRTNYCSDATCGGPDSRPGDPLKTNQFSRILQSKAPAVLAAIDDRHRFRCRFAIGARGGAPLRRGQSVQGPGGPAVEVARRANSENKKKPGRNGRAF